MHDRRLGYRIPFDAMVTSYVRDRPIRALASNLSDTGLSMSAIAMLAPPPGLVVGLELELPGMTESIWASARICHRSDDRLASGLGVRFLAMATSQARAIRDFCIEMRRKHLGTLLARVRA
jgi:c-di-GMP-binding flagellar brake protein YcgR